MEQRARRIRTEIRENLAWTSAETVSKDRPKYRNKFLAENTVPFSLALLVKLKRSCFGTFLASFNQQQNAFLNENKLGIYQWIMKEATPAQEEILKKDNNLTDDLEGLLVQGVETRDVLDLNYLFESLVSLRLSNYHVSKISLIFK